MSGEAGAAGQGMSLRVEVTASEGGCTTRELASSWSVFGGTEPYAWTLVQAPAGFALTADGDHATVAGTPAVPGDQRVRIRVTDADGNSGEREWVAPVLATPVLAPRSLPGACPSERYAQSFNADGASAAGLTWSANPEFVAQTGLDFEGERLTGAFSGAEGQNFELEVTVANGACVADPVTFTLAALEADDPSCPDLVASTASGSSESLPQPCAGQSYEVELLVEGGSGNYELEAVTLPDGASFDATSQTLSGDLSVPGAATLRVTDDNGHTIEKSFAVEPRTSCWLAYLSDETGVSRLHLFDPELDRRQVLPDDGARGPVLDFAFSPDGRALAFRSAAAPDTTRLELVLMASLHTSPIAFESTTAYAWSEDSATLAVAYDTANVRYLGGVELAGATAVEDPLVTALTPIEAAVDAELLWFAEKFVGFLSNTRVDTAWLGMTSRAPGGFNDLAQDADVFYEASSWLRSGASGVFLVPPTNFNIMYFGADGSPPVLHDQIPRALRAIAPSGRYLARVTEPNLELFPAELTSSLGAPAQEVEPGCDAILAWARGRERIACATSEDGGRVSIFDVTTATDRLEERELVRGSYALAKGSQTQRWRAFSTSGARFAFTLDGALYVAILDDGTPRAERLGNVTPADESPYAELVFSPDESLLLAHRGGYGRLFPTVAGAIPYFAVTDSMRPSVRCEEDFTGRTGPYCGTELTGAPYAWSGDSRWLAYQEETGTLKVMDLREIKVPIVDRITVGEPCAETCPGGSAFAYQPE